MARAKSRGGAGVGEDMGDAEEVAVNLLEEAAEMLLV